MAKKEKNTKAIRVVMQPSLYEKLIKVCDRNYTTVSAAIRDMIVKYTKESDAT